MSFTHVDKQAFNILAPQLVVQLIHAPDRTGGHRTCSRTKDQQDILAAVILAETYALASQRRASEIRRPLPWFRTRETAWRHPFQDFAIEVLVVICAKPQHCLCSSIYSK